LRRKTRSTRLAARQSKGDETGHDTGFSPLPITGWPTRFIPPMGRRDRKGHLARGSALGTRHSALRFLLSALLAPPFAPSLCPPHSAL
jgi:hypothetical protein